MKKLINKILLLVVSLTVLFSACKRSDKDLTTVGPTLVSATSEFAFVDTFSTYGYRHGNGNQFGDKPTPANRFLNFSLTTDSVGFNFTMNQVASYRITITGRTSNAQFVVTGTSDFSKAKIAGPTWVGESTNGILFRDNIADVKFEVLINNAYVVKGKEVLYLQAINTNYNDSYKVFLLDDFEAGTKFGTPYSDVLEKKYFSYNMNFKNSNILNYGGVQGKYCLHWSTFDEDLNTYGGGTDMVDGPGDSPFRLYKSITTNNPDSLFINAYICGTGKVGTSFLAIAWEQDSVSFTFAGPGLKPAKYRTDRWGVEYPITWEGWRLVSIPYSAFKKLNATYGNGNGIMEPKNFGGISIGLDSYPAGGKEVEFYVDYLVATQGAPFKP